MFVYFFLQGSLSIAASIHTEEPGIKWRSFMQGVFFLIWQVKKTKHLAIQVPSMSINFAQ